MTKLYLLLGFLISTLCSCIQYPHKATYQLGESYTSAKLKVDRYYDEQTRNFNLFQDRVTCEKRENRPGAESEYSLSRWAPDIGSQLLHESKLSKSGASGSTFEVTAKGILRWGASPANRVKSVDEWVVANLKVRKREIGEQRPVR